MIAIGLALALAAAPKDCGEDRACFDAAARTCEPAKYTLKTPQNGGGMKAVQVETFVLEGKTEAACVLKLDVSMEKLEVDPMFADLKDTFLRRVASDPKSHVKCNLPPESIGGWLDDGRSTAKRLADDHYAKCTTTGCGAKPKLAKGCSLSECTMKGWRLDCGELRCFDENGASSMPGVLLKCANVGGKPMVDIEPDGEKKR